MIELVRNADWISCAHRKRLFNPASSLTGNRFLDFIVDEYLVSDDNIAVSVLGMTSLVAAIRVGNYQSFALDTKRNGLVLLMPVAIGISIEYRHNWKKYPTSKN